ncbi:hypothetical protein GCM10007853_25760 [Algimonas ampicilliniresistens]|uniref:Uncharacterized protein n=1 Tax=Algimonas ampicilliniresistens TaxID=1298735 RepID=A0ABQ5VC92_9PROT|nr:hypothetical protein [Algimonas ampicilliniresistens]GLQ24702.1 hypothetical protein GCM10007853_25760 [Algimonas ampicilliniresistens]
MFSSACLFRRDTLYLTGVCLAALAIGSCDALTGGSDGATADNNYAGQSVPIIPVEIVDEPVVNFARMSGFTHRGAEDAFIGVENVNGPATLLDNPTGETISIPYDGEGYLMTFLNQEGNNNGRLDSRSYTLTFQGEDGTGHNLALVRQSPEELAEGGVDKPDGYTILSVNTLDFSDADRFRTIPMSPDYASGVVLPEAKATQDGLDIAARASAWINARALRYSGPASRKAETMDVQMRALERGETALRIAGFRDLWLNLAHSAGGEARIVDFVSYSPQYDDLTPYSHQLAEFNVDGRWVAIDPINNSLFQTEGKLLSAVELREQLRHDIDSVSVVPLVDGQTRNVRGQGSQAIALVPLFRIARSAGVIQTYEIDWTDAP